MRSSARSAQLTTPYRVVGQDDHVVEVPCIGEVAVASREDVIQIVQHHVRQERRERRPLRDAPLTRAFQELPDEPQHLLVTHPSGHFPPTPARAGCRRRSSSGPRRAQGASGKSVRNALLRWRRERSGPASPPKECREKSASKIGSNKSRSAPWITRSPDRGDRDYADLAPSFGISLRRYGRGRYVFVRSSAASSVRNPVRPRSSIALNVSPSDPGAPPLRFASRYAASSVAGFTRCTYSPQNRCSGADFARWPIRF